MKKCLVSQTYEKEERKKEEKETTKRMKAKEIKDSACKLIPTF